MPVSLFGFVGLFFLCEIQYLRLKHLRSEHVRVLVRKWHVGGSEFICLPSPNVRERREAENDVRQR